MYYALIPAAGHGARMQTAQPKQYLPLRGRPLLWHTIASLSAHPQITQVALILSPDDPYFIKEVYADLPGIEKLRVHYCGGDTRAQTVRAGLQAIAPHVKSDSWVLVHDAARPCLSVALLDRLILCAGQDPVGGILALPVADTIKQGDAEQHIVRTVPRDTLWLAQTPQMFRYALLCQALDRAQHVTDEASAVEASGHAPCLVPGSTHNIKVTYPDDLPLAEAILATRGEIDGAAT